MLCDIEIITHPKYPRNILLKQKNIQFFLEVKNIMFIFASCFVRSTTLFAQIPSRTTTSEKETSNVQTVFGVHSMSVTSP